MQKIVLNIIIRNFITDFAFRFIPVIIQLQTQAIFKMHVMFYQVKPLHKKPDINIYTLSGFEFKIIFIQGGITWPVNQEAACIGIICFVAVVGKSKVNNPPVGS